MLELFTLNRIDVRQDVVLKSLCDVGLSPRETDLVDLREEAKTRIESEIQN